MCLPPALHDGDLSWRLPPAKGDGVNSEAESVGGVFFFFFISDVVTTFSTPWPSSPEMVAIYLVEVRL